MLQCNSSGPRTAAGGASQHIKPRLFSLGEGLPYLRETSHFVFIYTTADPTRLHARKSNMSRAHADLQYVKDSPAVATPSYPQRGLQLAAGANGLLTPAHTTRRPDDTDQYRAEGDGK